MSKSKAPKPFVSRIPELSVPVLPHPLPGFGQRVCATMMAIDLIKLIDQCDNRRYNAEVRDRAAQCLDYELADIARHKTNIVWA